MTQLTWRNQRIDDRKSLKCDDPLGYEWMEVAYLDDKPVARMYYLKGDCKTYVELIDSVHAIEYRGGWAQGNRIVVNLLRLEDEDPWRKIFKEAFEEFSIKPSDDAFGFMGEFLSKRYSAPKKK